MNGPRIVRIRVRRVKIPLRAVYVSSMYMHTTASRTLVELETDGGVVGIGESLGTEECYALVVREAKAWIGEALWDRRSRRERYAGNVFDNRNGRTGWAAFAGLEMASWDATAQCHSVPIGALFGIAYPVEAVEVVCPLPAAIVSPSASRADLHNHMRDVAHVALVADLAARWRSEFGFRSFKYKSAGGNADWDVAVMTKLRETLGPTAQLRFDPNGAYGTAAAIELGRRLRPLGLEFLEDPTDDIEGLRTVRSGVGIPVATNMSAIQFDQLIHAVRAEAVDVLLADVYMWGGVEAFLEMTAAATALRRDVGIHSLFETGIGTALNLHLAQALKVPRRANDVGVHWMECLLTGVSSLAIRDGAIEVPPGNGLGVALDEDEVDRYTQEMVEVL